MTVKIKATSITNLTDARYFAAAGVAWMGFNFEQEAANYIHPHKAGDIMEWLQGPAMVGEFGLSPLENVKPLIETLPLEFVQVRAVSHPEQLKLLHVPIILEIQITPGDDEKTLSDAIDIYSGFSEIYLLNFRAHQIHISENGFGFPVLKKLCRQHKIILDAAYNSQDIRHIIDEIQPEGIQLHGSDEIKKGAKYFDELDEIISSLEV